jgi:undecaprenyl-diphosphatase
MRHFTCSRAERETTDHEGRRSLVGPSLTPATSARAGAPADRGIRCRVRARSCPRPSDELGCEAGRADARANGRPDCSDAGDGHGHDDRHDRALTDLDHSLERWIVEHRIGWLDPVFVGLSYAGSYGVVWLAIGIAVAVSLRRPGIALAVPLVVVAADLSATGIKHAVGRPRPAAALGGIDALMGSPSSSSFPSGHAATSFAAAVVLALAVPRLAPLVFCLAAAIAFSRLYVGVHYPSDVAGGAVLGVAVATALLLLLRTLRRPRSRLTQVPSIDRSRDSRSRRTRRE